MVELTTDRRERVAPGARLHASRDVAERHRAGASDQTLEVRGARPLKPGADETTGLGRWVVSFAGVRSREQAESLRGLALTAEALATGDDLWVHQLIGAEVRLPDGTAVGVVKEVEANPASDLLVLEGGTLIPLTFVTSHGDGEVVVEVPNGLLDSAGQHGAKEP